MSLGLISVWQRVEKKTLIGTGAFRLRAKHVWHHLIFSLPFRVTDVLLRHHASISIIIRKLIAHILVPQYLIGSLHVILRTQRMWI